MVIKDLGIIVSTYLPYGGKRKILLVDILFHVRTYQTPLFSFSDKFPFTQSRAAVNIYSLVNATYIQKKMMACKTAMTDDMQGRAHLLLPIDRPRRQPCYRTILVSYYYGMNYELSSFDHIIDLCSSHKNRFDQ